MQNKVYIAVSGCKRGFSLLYTSPGLDTGYTGMAQSLCDMRQYLRLTKPGIDYFAIDFIPGFRVCSIYRSTIDSAGSSGGFISVALIIPDNVVTPYTRHLLSLLLETYYSEYYNRQFATPLPGKAEQGAALETLLQSHAADFSVKPLHFRPGVSDFNSPPLYAAGGTDTVVDTLFASPYHQSYLPGAKLIMLPAPVMAQPGAYGVTFNTDIRSITISPGLSDRMVGRLMPLGQQGCAVTRFILNGTDFTSSYSSVCLLPSDRIDFTVSLPNGKFTSFEGSVQQALANKILFPTGDTYGFNFFPFDIAVAVRGLVTGLPRENMLFPALATGKETVPLSVNARGEAHYTVHAPFSTAAIMLVDPEGNKVSINDSFLSASSDLRATYPVDMRPLTIRFPRIIRGKARLEIGQARLPIDITPDPLTVLIPASLKQSMYFCAGKNRWLIDPATGVCTGGDRPGKTVPVWVWAAVAGALIAIGVLIWFMFSGHRKPAVKKAPITIVKPQRTVKEIVDTGFSHGVDADGTVITHPDADKNNEEEKQVEKASDLIKEGMEVVTDAHEESGPKYDTPSGLHDPANKQHRKSRRN